MNRSSAAKPSPVDSLPPQQQRRLMEVLEAYLAELERGVPPDPDRLVRQHPELAGPLRAYLEGLDFLHQATAGLEAAGDLGGTSGRRSEERPASAVDDFSEKRLGDYTIIRELGRGGMGVVYEAKQISLDRRVALKVLPFAAVLDRRQISRFENEARAAAQLHHSNIVPVFSVGCERGIHYYAMQYIEGQPLDLAVRDLRQVADTEVASGSASGRPREGPAVVGDRRLGSTLKAFSTAPSVNSREYFRTVAELGIQAAEALQHAHEYGVIHRDVKPSNLLLDAEGKLWITDFGLARIQADASLSATGDVMGTVRYMSPEQAAGSSGVVDQRTDVYSLGITLYELLTLREAFDCADRQSFLRRISHEEPRPPRRVNPAVPPDLETIVLKATAKSPQRRYTTAGELAEDLRRFLEGKPTLARRPTIADRAGKWIRRHKTVVVSAVMLMAVALVGLTVGTLLIAREHGKTKDALADSEHHRLLADEALAQSEKDRRRAETHFRQARQVVDHVGTLYAQQLADVPGAELVRRQLLDDTRNYYRQFIELVGDQSGFRSQLALTHSKLAAVTEQIGDTQEALAGYRRAKQILQELARGQPDVQKHRKELALCCNNMGLLLGRTGKTDEAERSYRTAIELQERLVQVDPAAAAFRGDLALSYGNLGLLQSQTGRDDEAERSYMAAIRIRQRLADDHPRQAEYRSDLAIGYNNLGLLCSRTDPAKAQDWCRRALALQKELVAAEPKSTEYRADLALSYSNLGVLQSRSNRPRQAEASYLEAITRQRRLVGQSPLVVRFRRDLAVSCNNLGRCYSKLKRPREAIESFAEARRLLEDLVADYPSELNLRSSLAVFLNNRGMALEQLDRPEEAKTAYLEAIRHQEFARKNAPRMAQFRQFLSRHYFNYGRVLRETGHWQEAARWAWKRKQLWPGDPQRLYRVAEELALAVGQVDMDKGGSSQEATRRKYADRAVDTLREAVKAGYNEVDQIAEDPDLKPLHEHPPFRKMLEELREAKNKRQGA